MARLLNGPLKKSSHRSSLHIHYKLLHFSIMQVWVYLCWLFLPIKLRCSPVLYNYHFLKLSIYFSYPFSSMYFQNLQPFVEVSLFPVKVCFALSAAEDIEWISPRKRTFCESNGETAKETERLTKSFAKEFPFDYYLASTFEKYFGLFPRKNGSKEPNKWKTQHEGKRE